MSSFKLESHPGRLLYNHLRQVGERSKDILSGKRFKNKQEVLEAAYVIGVSHDFAKSTTFFQKYLRDHQKTEKTYHGLSSAVFSYLALKQLQREGKFCKLGTIAFLVVAHHHGNLKNLRGENGELLALKDRHKQNLVKKQIEDILHNQFDEVKIMYEKLIPGLDVSTILSEMSDQGVFRQIMEDLKRVAGEKDIDNYILSLLLFSVLIDSDKLHASQTKIPERVEVPPDLIEKYKADKFTESSPINQLRENAYNEVVASVEKQKNLNQIFTITLPTGMGKTLTGLEAALKLRKRISSENGYTPRVIYCLPFLSIIDQNSDVVEDVLLHSFSDVPSNLFLKHHHLADMTYRESNSEEFDPDNAALLITSWYSEIVLTTFYQFFHSLVTNKNRASKKFHNIVNSVILLDEIQSLPHMYWLLVEKMLSSLTCDYGCAVILMTATQPLIAHKNSIELVSNVGKYFNQLDRVDYDFGLEEKSIQDFGEELLRSELHSSKSLLIVLNTINACQQVYEYVVQELEGEVDSDGVRCAGDTEIYLLNTRLLSRDRLKKIKRIKSSSKRLIIVSTQLIEAGVDISVDRVFRDMAPLDSIIQCGGRCNRNNSDDRGKIHVIRLMDEKKEFAKYIYGTILLQSTHDVLNAYTKGVRESEFTRQASKEYFKKIVERGSSDESEGILENLSKLNFKESSEFKLIKEVEKATIYLEVDDSAKTQMESMKKLLEWGDTSRDELRSLRKSLNEYTINIYYNKKSREALDHLHPLPNLSDVYCIPFNQCKEWYNKETGFQILENAGIDLRIL